MCEKLSYMKRNDNENAMPRYEIDLARKDDPLVPVIQNG